VGGAAQVFDDTRQTSHRSGAYERLVAAWTAIGELDEAHRVAESSSGDLRARRGASRRGVIELGVRGADVGPSDCGRARAPATRSRRSAYLDGFLGSPRRLGVKLRLLGPAARRCSAPDPPIAGARNRRGYRYSRRCPVEPGRSDEARTSRSRPPATCASSGRTRRARPLGSSANSALQTRLLHPQI